MKPTGMTWRSAARTDMGKVRTRNEDAVLDRPQQGLWAVADGMGGHARGDLASLRLVSRLGALPAQTDFESRLQAVRESLHDTHHRLIADSAGTVSGSTVVVLILEGQQGACIWAGDSRCYLWREQRLYQLSRDHSFARQLMEQEHMSPGQAMAHPDARALTRAVGAGEPLTLDILAFAVQPGDVFLLCSDGLYQDLSPKALGQAMNEDAPHTCLARLFDAVLAGEARDNLSAVVIAQ